MRYVLDEDGKLQEDGYYTLGEWKLSGHERRQLTEKEKKKLKAKRTGEQKVTNSSKEKGSKRQKRSEQTSTVEDEIREERLEKLKAQTGASCEVHD